MPRLLRCARFLPVSLVVATFLSLGAPISVTLASTDLVSGDSAVIADANGDTVRLRSKPGSSSSIVAEYSEGTALDIIDGPTWASDDTAWYRVAVEGQVGYIAADFLVSAGALEEVPVVEEPEVEATAAPTTEATNDEINESVEITGTSTIVNTNGDPIRCRATANSDSEILALLYEGSSVDLTGDAQDGWQPVRCEDQFGWVSTEFVGAPAAATASPEVEVEAEVEPASIAGSGVIAGTNGDGARCRAKKSTSASIITTLAEGVTVDLRGSQSGDWMPVKCSGKNGYVWSEFVSVSSSGGSGGGITGQGVISNTDGQGVRCRQSASYEGKILGVLVEGNEVELRGDRKGDWQPVVCSGKKGYVHADFVERSAANGNSGTNNGGNSGGFASGDTLKVDGTNGTGVRLRSSASSSASVITVVGEGAVVTVRSGSSGSWIAVKSQNMTGFIHKDYLVATEDDAPATPEPHDALASGDHAKVTDRINFRSEASYTGSVIGMAQEGIVVLVTGASREGFFPVEWGNQAGFMHGDYLTWTDEALSTATSGVGGNAGSGTPSEIGQAMVDYASNYLGYPYIWATAGPNSFDCSGFTYWVTKHVTGEDIGRGLWTQIVAGTPVSYGNLKPGDIVFFQNTYTWGLSHVGIYIGNNQFIHAENEDTGVRISSLTSNYYSTRYYGAVRLG